MIPLTKECLNQVIVKRAVQSHKGSYGRVVCIGGRKQYGGAILMCAQACVNSGAGLVTVMTDASTIPVLQSRLPEAMALTFHDPIAELVATADVIVIGPGLGTDPIAKECLAFVLSHQTATQWLVIDGSAITLLAQHPIAAQTIDANQQAQQRLGCTLVLKSEQTHIYTHKAIYQNTYGNPAMATGGMGDTLAGIIGGFLGQFGKTDQLAESAIGAAVTIHSLIADELADKHYVVLPTMISEQLSKTMRRFCPLTR